MLYLYSVFHCNLAFSLIPRDHFSKVVERCYWPLLELTAGGTPLAIEMSAWTLNEVNSIDPGFVRELKRLWDEGKCEFIGSGYSQAIFPLIPAEVNRWNLEAGARHYKRLLGRVPDVALVNEQTYARGLVDIYRQAGYRALVMDWDNSFRHNRYPKDHLYYPQKARGINATADLLWSNSIAFQKFQRCVHGEMPIDEYVNYLKGQASCTVDRSFALYTNDAEVFDYRPGHDIEPSGEFERVREIISGITAIGGVEFVTPGQVIERLASHPGSGNILNLESAETPVVTKKQGKYNPVRWAAAGRDSVHINTECYKVYANIKGLEKAGTIDDATLTQYREVLADLWGSDFRTNTIDEKYRYFQNRLGWLRLETERVLMSGQKVAVGGGTLSTGVFAEDSGGCCADGAEEHGCEECACRQAPGKAAVKREDNFLKVETPSVRVDFLANKGYAIASLVFPAVDDKALVGTLEHGYYDDIGYGADFFSGHFIHVGRDGAKTTDLEPGAEADVEDGPGGVTVSVKTPVGIGTLWKVFQISKTEPEVRITYRLKVRGLLASSLRLGIFTFLPHAFDGGSLWFESVNGGSGPEKFYLAGRRVAHDEAVSPTVSATACLGATDGVVRIGDKDKLIEVSTDKSKLFSVPMIRYEEMDGETGPDKRFFLRLTHTVGEVDDTAWWVWRGYNEIDFTLRAARTAQ